MGKILSLVLAICIFLAPKTVFSADNFFVSSEVTYDVGADDSAKVHHKITITNEATEIHATDYTLTLSGANISNVVAFDENKDFETEVATSGGNTTVKVLFPDAVVGEGAEREFQIEYVNHAIVTKNGSIREIKIPRLANESTYDSYLVRLKLPSSLGSPAYISPEPDNRLTTSTGTTYYFDKTILNKAGVTAAFGESQIFSFDLTYHLQNPLAISTNMEIALPPDTSFQKVFFNTISPVPDDVKEDADGNWIAIYKLGARERLDVRALGSAQIFSSPWKTGFLSESEKESNLRPTKYWQSDSAEIKELAAQLKTPRAIYDYVVDTLSYDYNKITQGTDRLGALGVLNTPKGAICTEFTDLFIAIARAAGIPAREVNGFAYTDNATLQPLSLVADVLHAWPEYWDEERSVWVPVDPTWGNTTGGIDYFTYPDMKHFSFVMHGVSPESPIPAGSYKLGPNPQKDVFVSLGETPEQINIKPEIFLAQRNTLPFNGLKLKVNIKNPSGVALYNQNLKLLFDGKAQYEKDVPIVLPYETRAVEFSIPYGLLGRNTPNEAIVLFGEEKLVFTPDKKPAIIRDLASLAFIIVSLSVITFLILRKK